MKLYGIALSEASQRLRCHRNVQQVYTSLYGTSDLVVSIDAPAALTLHTLRDRKQSGGAGRLFAGSSLKPHVDQTLKGPSSSLVAHLTTLPGAFPYPVQAGVICLPQLPKLHTQTKQWVAPPGFVAMLGEQPAVKDTGEKEFRVLCEAEIPHIEEKMRYIPIDKCSMVLWRSDVVHNSYGGDPECFEGLEGGQFCRLMQLTCMCPRSAREPKAAELKAAMWDTESQRAERESHDTRKTKRPIPGACSTHYPHVCVWNGCGPGHYSNPREGQRHWKTHRAQLLEAQRKML